MAGNTITVQLEPHKESIAALITHVFEPFTLSCVMVVRLFQKEGLGNPTVLKLFDRRFASQLREEAEVEPWTMESEAQYHRFIQNGSAAEFITSFDEDYMSEDEEEDVAKKRHTYTMKCRDCTKQHGKCKAPSKTSKGNVFHIFYTP